MIAVGAGHAANGNHPVGQPGDLRHVLIELHARKRSRYRNMRPAGGLTGLGIPGFELAGAAAHEHEDHAFVVLTDSGRILPGKQSAKPAKRDAAGHRSLQESPAREVMLMA
jgi:hypothetical protein